MNDTEWKMIDRFKEPSSWGVFGSALGMFGISVPGGLMQALSLIGSGACLLIAFLMKEGQAKP